MPRSKQLSGSNVSEPTSNSSSQKSSDIDARILDDDTDTATSSSDKSNIVWLQAQTDAGCSMSVLNAQQPDIYRAMEGFDFEFDYMNTINPTSGADVMDDLQAFANGEREVDVLAVEGAIPRGPDGTGMACIIGSRSLSDWVDLIAPQARYVLAVGTCAAFGNIPAAGPNPTDATGVQYHRREPGGFLGESFTAQSGKPVINISGCPVHPDWVIHTLGALLRGEELELDAYQRPTMFFSDVTVHQGCPRNEHYEYKQAAKEPGDPGCLYLNMGCEGPQTHAPCNRDRWNRQKSLTQVGIPCHGCNQPDFPEAQMPFFERRDGVTPQSGMQAAAYAAGAGFMKLAAPDRLNATSDREDDS